MNTAKNDVLDDLGTRTPHVALKPPWYPRSTPWNITKCWWFSHMNISNQCTIMMCIYICIYIYITWWYMYISWNVLPGLADFSATAGCWAWRSSPKVFGRGMAEGLPWENPWGKPMGKPVDSVQFPSKSGWILWIMDGYGRYINYR